MPVLVLGLSLSTGTLRERAQTPGLTLCFLPSRSRPPGCRHTSPSPSLTCKQRGNRSTNAITLVCGAAMKT